MKILMFGQTGQVATEIQRLAKGGVEGGIKVEALSRSDANLTKPDQLRDAIAQTDADAIINAAAYTAVDKAEDETELAHAINAEAPRVMAEAAAKRKLPFVHISTDYVFDGSGEHIWKPEDSTDPQGVYGQSKLAGEQSVVAVGGTYAILRTAWVFSAHGNNFVKTMLRLGADRDALNVVADQIGGPTAAADIARTVVDMAAALTKDASLSGTYHYAGAPSCSWADFATDIFEKAGLDVRINPISSSEYPTPAKRPLNSRLDCSSLKKSFGIEQPNWQMSLRDVLSELDALK